MSEQDELLTKPPVAPMWPMALRYGLLTALVLFAFGMLLELSGLVDPVARKGTGYTYLITFAVLFGGLYLAIKEYKKECGNKITFGTALKFATLTSVVIAILGGILALVQMTLINPDMVDQIREYAIADMENRGMTEEQIEQGRKVMEVTTTPVVLSIFGGIFQFIFAFLMALIGAAIHQNAKNPSVN
jgi:uncharacterized membrane protein YjgN (DUF898 family)